MTTTEATAQPGLVPSVTRALARASAPIGRVLSHQSVIPLWGVVHYRGRKTGRELSTPVQIRATDDAFVIALPWGSDTQWVKNVCAAGAATVTWGGSDHAVDSPEVLTLDQATAFSNWQRGILGVLRIREFLRLRRVATSKGA